MAENPAESAQQGAMRQRRSSLVNPTMRLTTAVLQTHARRRAIVTLSSRAHAGWGFAVVGAIATFARSASSSRRLYTRGAAIATELKVPATRPIRKV